MRVCVFPAMNQFAALLAPLALLLPGAAAVDGGRLVPQPTTSAPAPDVETAQGQAWLVLFDAFRSPVQEQVRIEQRMTIRISPRPPAPPPNMLMELPQNGLAPQFEERAMGRCLPISGVVGVQAGRGNRLLLFMRDRRIVSAELERACRARDFYSGFYVERSADGQLCIDRDKLQSRSGANCSVKRLRQLVEGDD